MKTELFKELKEIRKKVDEKEKELKELKENLKNTMDMCVDEMLQEGIDNVKIDGTLFSLNVLERPNINKEHEEKFFRYLKRLGYGDLIVTKKAVNYQTLGKWYREFMKEHPEKARYLNRYLNIYVDKKIVFRGIKNGH